MDRKILKNEMMDALHDDYDTILFMVPNIRNAVDRAKEFARYQHILEKIEVLELSDDTMFFLSKVHYPLKEISHYMIDGSDLESALKEMMLVNCMMQDMVQT